MSRPSSSVPKGCEAVGPFRRLKGSIAFGALTPGNHAAPTAQTMTRPIHARQIHSPMFSRRAERRRSPAPPVATCMIGGRGAPGSTTGARGSLSSCRSDIPSPDPWIEHRIEHVDDEVDDHEGGCDEERHALHRHEIPLIDAVHEQLPDSWDVEEG